MNKSDMLHNTLITATILMLLGVLAFFYDKTQAVNLREQNEVLGLLNELKDIDKRWDVEAQQARIDLEPTDSTASPRADPEQQALRDITQIASHASSPALRAGLSELRLSITRKAELFARFKLENLRNKRALQAMLANTSELQRANLANAPAPLLGTLAEQATRYYLHAQPEQLAALLTSNDQLQHNNVIPRDNLERNSAAITTLSEHVPLEIAAFEQLAALTSGPRLVQLGMAFNAEQDALFQDKERYRIYLVYYAAALLVLLGYLGFKLKAANQSLEQRVATRTQELSRAMQQLQESEAQLIQSEKMSSLGQMVAGVAHEINTPLAYVKNSLGRVAEHLPHLHATLTHGEQLLALLAAGNDPEALSREFQHTAAQLAALKQQHVLEELEGLVKDGLFGTQQVTEIVANLKDFSRLDRSKITPFNLNDGLNSTLLLAKHLLKNIEVRKHFGELPVISCSPSQLNQVFLNLITNAAQALPAEHGTITLNSRVANGGIEIDVIDSGQGIPTGILNKIFDPFFTTKAIGKGTGLGLSICYKIIQQHGGHISVDSQIGLGSKFTVWLPLQAPATLESNA